MSAVRSSGRLLIERPTDAAPAAGFEAVAATPAARWEASPPVGGTAHPWDEAHAAVADPARLGFEAAAQPAYAEPDLLQRMPYWFPPGDAGFESFTGNPCEDRGPRPFWPVGEPALGWHLLDGYSQLKSARAHVRQNPNARPVRAAILDTGYDPDHPTRPTGLSPDLGWNFVDNRRDATDPGRHFPGNQPGHGTATVALLAGNRVRLPSGFDDWLGGAPDAEVVPVRIADSVVHFYTSAMAAGLRHAVARQCQVVSVSMGGLPARSWAAAVNEAYEAGVAVFAAAGNRIGPSPPSAVVYPARFARVTAVCGVTADGSPYYRPGVHGEMQGCFGPPGVMTTAVAAYTPNAPWALMGCPTGVGFGGGTSSATPQAAAAACLWLAHVPEPAGGGGWKRVEAVRYALFASADATAAETFTYFGNGKLKARAALDVPYRTDLPPAPAAEVSFPWLRPIDLFESSTAGRERMFEVEALHAFLQTPDLQKLVDGADPMADPLTPALRQRLLTALRQSPLISDSLRKELADLITRG